MRIVLVTGEYPPMQGGVGDFTRELARALAAMGHVPHIFTSPAAGAPAHETDGAVSVHRVASAWGWATRRELEAFAKSIRADVINLQYQAAAYQMHAAINVLPGALARRIPLTVTFHDLRVPYLFPKAGPLRWRAIVGMARGASACIVTNSEDMAALRRVRVAASHLVPIGSNVRPDGLDGYNRAAWLRERGIPNDLALIGYFGFLNESKGAETLMRALAILRDRGANVGVLHIGGQTGASDPTNAEHAQRLRALGAENGAGPFWFETGFLEPPDVSAGFASCACVALPYRDGASFRRGTLMAAIAHGAAIVTTWPRVSVPEFVSGSNMLMLEPDAARPLADTLAVLLNAPILRTRLQAGATQLRGLFAWPKIARQTAEVLAQTMAQTE